MRDNRLHRRRDRNDRRSHFERNQRRNNHGSYRKSFGGSFDNKRRFNNRGGRKFIKKRNFRPKLKTQEQLDKDLEKFYKRKGNEEAYKDYLDKDLDKFMQTEEDPKKDQPIQANNGNEVKKEIEEKPKEKLEFNKDLIEPKPQEEKKEEQEAEEKKEQIKIKGRPKKSKK